MSKHVAVLMGGWSAERNVSLTSGAACAAALREAGYRVTEIDINRDIALVLANLRPDVCFNALHGPAGEDGSIQGLLNIMAIPYTHSGVEASAIAMNKPQAKAVFMRAGLRCPEGYVRRLDDIFERTTLSLPLVVKPLNQGSSVGVQILRRRVNELLADANWSYGEQVLVEKYIPGRELTVGVLEGQPLCVTEITSDRGFYDYGAKYEPGGSVHVLPAPLPDAVTEEALATAARAHDLLGCRGVTRSDFRYDDTGNPHGALYLLEINTQPGMTATSLLPEQAEFCGYDFPELVTRIVENARCDS